MLCTAIAVRTCSTWVRRDSKQYTGQFDEVFYYEHFNGWLADANGSSNAGPASAQRSQFVSSHAEHLILNYLLDMSTRSRAANGRYIATVPTTDPTGGGGDDNRGPDLSANTETEPVADQGAVPDAGDLAGQGGEDAGTDTESSTEPFQDGSGQTVRKTQPTSVVLIPLKSSARQQKMGSVTGSTPSPARTRWALWYTPYGQPVSTYRV